MIDFVDYLPQGDAGHDFVAFEASLNGGVPYRDYFWAYGPLMPSYYAIFYKIFGISVQSLMIGRMFLNILSGIFIFLSLRLFVETFIAILGAVWFWVFFKDFGHTFNHPAGVTAISFLVYLILKRTIIRSKDHWRFLSFGILILFLIKLNVGLAAVVAFGLALVIMNRMLPKGGLLLERGQFLKMFLTPILASSVVYLFLFCGLSLDYLKQCCLTISGYRQPDNSFILILFNTLYSVKDVFSNAFQGDIPNYRLGDFTHTLGGVVTFSSCFLGCILCFHFRRSKNIEKRSYVLIYLVLFILLIFFLHELFIAGVIYAINWGASILVIMMFLFWGNLVRIFPYRLVRQLVICSLIILIMLGLYGKFLSHFLYVKRPLPFSRAAVYVLHPQSWKQTVMSTVSFLQSNLKKEELFFALPYEPLYYYLLGRPSPVKEIVFFDFLHITDAQQRRIIIELDAKKVNWVIVSNRSHSSERGLGYFGQTYGVILSAFIDQRFRLVETIGDWDASSEWIWPHAMRIYKRINPL